MDKKLLGRKINAARKDRGITGEQLAELCSINATYLRQIEAGTKIPSLPVFVTICKELKASPSYLLADSLEGSGAEDMDVLFGLWKKATMGKSTSVTWVQRGAGRCEGPRGGRKVVPEPCGPTDRRLSR